MWFKVKDLDVFILFEKQNEFHNMWATDFISVWTKRWSESELIDCLKISNPCLEINDGDLLAKGMLTLENLKEAKKIESFIAPNRQLTLSISRMFNYPFRINLELQEGSKELFFKKITIPLMETVNDLVRSEQELCGLLTRKDEEINEYKEEGGRIALRHLKTPKFNKTEHLNKHTSLSAYFAFDEFPSSTLEKNVDVSNVIVKKEPEEPQSVTRDTPQQDIIIKEEREQQNVEVSPTKKRKKLPV